MIFVWIFLLVQTVCAVKQKDIELYYFNQSSPTSHLYKFNLAEKEKFADLFDFSKPSVFMVHGWAIFHRSDDDTLISKAILTNNDVNYFSVEYPFRLLYPQAVDTVTIIGEYLGDFLNILKTEYRYSLDKVRLVGHSLGCHICGVAGKKTHGEITSITGLDPAGPLFNYSIVSNRLTNTDAKYVEIVHTSSNSYGIGFNCGTADFYPNGGEIQPGCDLISTCSHLRAIDYFVQSVLNKNDFIATKCPSYDLFKQGMCLRNSKAYMGGFKPDSWAKGTYYLTTN